MASFRRLSPERIVRIRCGGRSCFRTAIAAAASGGDTIAPSAIAAAQGIEGTTARVTTATAAVVRSDAHDREARDGNPVVLQVPRRRVVGGIQKHRRDEKRERHLGVDRERGRARDEREDRAAQREEGRIRRAHPSRDRGEDDGHEQDGEEGLEAGH